MWSAFSRYAAPNKRTEDSLLPDAPTDTHTPPGACPVPGSLVAMLPIDRISLK